MERRLAAGKLRLAQAAEMLGADRAAMGRWVEEGRLRVEVSPSGRRLVPMADVAAILIERAGANIDAVVAAGDRNRFRGTVVRIERDRVAAIVEIVSGPHLVVSMLSADAVDAHGLVVGVEAVASVKATNVSVESVPAERAR